MLLPNVLFISLRHCLAWALLVKLIVLLYIHGLDRDFIITNGCSCWQLRWFLHLLMWWISRILLGWTLRKRTSLLCIVPVSVSHSNLNFFCNQIGSYNDRHLWRSKVILRGWHFLRQNLLFGAINVCLSTWLAQRWLVLISAKIAIVALWSLLLQVRDLLFKQVALLRHFALARPFQILI